MSFFETEAKISADPIVGLVQKASQDSHADKLLAIVGAAIDDNGKLIIPEVISEAAKEISMNLDMSYLPSSGLKGLAELILKEIIGIETLKNLYDLGIKNSEVVSNGGTQAISSILTACTQNNDPILLPNPHWAGYDSICTALKRKNIYSFELLDREQNFNTQALEQEINKAIEIHGVRQAKITLVINTPYDNPLGKDFGSDAWKSIAEILNKFTGTEFLIILDTAYLDFGPGGKDITRLNFLPDLFKNVTKSKLHVALAGTLSKSFALYGARVGVAAILSQDFNAVNNWKDTVGGILRGTVSNLSRPAQEIAFNILNDKNKLAKVHEFQSITSTLISQRTQHLLNLLDNKIPSPFDLIKPDGGFFVTLKIKDSVFQMRPDIGEIISQALIDNHLYIPVISNQYIRIPVCGLSKTKITLVLDRLINITKNIFARELPALYEQIPNNELETSNIETLTKQQDDAEYNQNNKIHNQEIIETINSTTEITEESPIIEGLASEIKNIVNDETKQDQGISA